MGPLFDHYRPELHYMRGPGPKWREKHGEAPTPVMQRRPQLPLSIWILPVTTIALLGLAAIVAFA